MIAFVLGNGISRRTLDVNLLCSLGTVYGCNALYRDHTPHVLVATDRPIAQKIELSGYPKQHRFYTRRPMADSGALQVPERYFGFSSGPIALALAAMEGHQRIYLLGFDMGPTETGRFNNIYADTEFYKKTENGPTFTGNWVKQISAICKDNPNCCFFRVFGPTTAEIDDLSTVRNLSKLELADFVARINTPKDL